MKVPMIPREVIEKVRNSDASNAERLEAGMRDMATFEKTQPELSKYANEVFSHPLMQRATGFNPAAASSIYASAMTFMMRCLEEMEVH